MLEHLKVSRVWSVVDRSVCVEPITSGYVVPEFKYVEGSIPSASYIVLSSAGAVGKSAFAAYLAGEKKAVVWDLSRVKLGTNSFVGTLARTFGYSQLSAVMASIAAGEMLFVFDAIDEAEIHSGREGVEIFVSEVVAACGSAPSSTAVFLARPDSAKRVTEVIRGSTESVARVEISFFNRESANQFCYAAYNRARSDNPASKEVFRRKLDEIFDSGVSGARSALGSWTPEDSEFYGYAPVLQAIAAVLAGSDNLHTFSMEETSRGKFLTCVMTSILERERGKFISNLSTLGLSSDPPDDLYAVDDQVLRLLKYSVGEAGWDRVEVANPSDSEALSKAVSSFLPQHPFIRDALDRGRGAFSGPAFRDYCIAHSLTSIKGDLRTYAEYFLLENPVVIASSVLFDIYNENSGGNVHVDHVSAIYDSFASSLGKSECFVDIYDDQGGPVMVLGRSGRECELRLIGSGYISISGGLYNAQIETGLGVSLEARDRFEVGSSYISVGSVELRCTALGIRGDVTISAGRIEAPANPVVPKLRHPDARLLVSFPGAERYPWSAYRCELVDEGAEDDALRMAHTVSRILRWFRKDRRAEFARYRDLIRKHIVGKGEVAQKAFAFLEQIGAVEERGSLYVLREDALERYGIRWAGATTEPSAQLLHEIRNYLVQ